MSGHQIWLQAILINFNGSHILVVSVSNTVKFFTAITALDIRLAFQFYSV